MIPEGSLRLEVFELRHLKKGHKMHFLNITKLLFRTQCKEWKVYPGEVAFGLRGVLFFNALRSQNEA